MALFSQISLKMIKKAVRGTSKHQQRPHFVEAIIIFNDLDSRLMSGFKMLSPFTVIVAKP